MASSKRSNSTRAIGIVYSFDCKAFGCMWGYFKANGLSNLRYHGPNL
jgi:hypothetical protein